MEPQQLNQFLQPTNSPVAMIGLGVPAWQFGVQQRLQTQAAKFSKVNLVDFVRLSGTASATGAIGNGTTLFLSTALTPNVPHQNQINFAVPYIGIYEGTTANSAFQIYPTAGGSITPGAYTVQGGLDFQGFATSVPQTPSVWKGIITDNSAGNKTILFVTQWRWLLYNSGTVT